MFVLTPFTFFKIHGKMMVAIKNGGFVIMRNHIEEPTLEYLIQGLLTLQTTEECRNFLEDLCTESELLEMSRRLQAAKMLKEKYIYSEIAAKTGLSTATISRVNRCMKYGNDGYYTVLENLDKEARHK